MPADGAGPRLFGTLLGRRADGAGPKNAAAIFWKEVILVWEELPQIERNDLIRRILDTIKATNKNISYLQAKDALEGTIEKLGTCSVLKG